MPKSIKEKYEVQEMACPPDPKRLTHVMDQFASDDPDAIHVVYLQYVWPVCQAIITNTLAHLCDKYSIIVIDWELGTVVRGGQIVDQLDNFKHLLIACSAKGKYGDLTKEVGRRKFFGGFEKGGAEGKQDPDFLSILVGALSTVRRAGKSRLLSLWLGNDISPLAKYLHPRTGWESYLQTNLFKAIDAAQQCYRTYVREALESEERDEFESSASWSFNAIDNAIRSTRESDVRETLVRHLDHGGLKSRFRVNFKNMLLEWANKSAELRSRIEAEEGKLPKEPSINNLYNYRGGVG